MKSIVSVILFLVFSSNIYAQGNRSENLVKHDYNPYHFGFILSFNQMNFSLKVNDDAIGSISNAPGNFGYHGLDYLKLLGINSQPVFGFTVGIVSNLKLAPLFDLRFVPSLAFGERKFNYSFIGYKDGESPTTITDQLSIRSTHIDLPLYVKFKSKRAHNVRAYVLSGVKYTFDLAANSEKNKENNEQLLILDAQDLLIEAGAGFDFYLPYFKFGIELKMSYGFNDLLQNRGNYYTQGIESIKSKLFQISFTFE